MKALINKELRLGLHPTVFIFAALGALYLVPSYPYFMTPFYSCLCIFYLFLSAREQNDLMFTMLTPSDKRKAVAARTVVVAGIELVHLVVSLPFAWLGMRINPNGGNLAGIEANPAFFGFVLAMLGLFNLVLIGGFYRTGVKVGVPFVKAISVYVFIYCLIDYVLIRFEPAKSFLDTCDSAMMIKQLPIFAVGAVMFAVLSVCAYKVGARNLERVDL